MSFNLDESSLSIGRVIQNPLDTLYRVKDVKTSGGELGTVVTKAPTLARMQLHSTAVAIIWIYFPFR